MITFKPKLVLDCWIGEAINAAASHINLAAGAMFNQSSANKASKAAHDEAQINRLWQEQMYRTRYRLTMRDMRAAGLNPILAANIGVGNVPAGATGTGYSAQFPTSNYQFGSAAKNLAEADEAEAKALENFAAARLKINQIATERARQGLMNQQERESVQSVLKIAAEIDKIRQEAKTSGALEDVYQKEQQKIDVMKQQLEFHNKRLEKVGNVYTGLIGQLIAYFNAIVGNANVGVMIPTTRHLR